jgi:hypothetical protein
LEQFAADPILQALWAVCTDSIRFCSGIVTFLAVEAMVR